ncbi:MAG: hypothetical protein PHR61_01740 [Candidatus Absconditabacteria bacterium]|nr:hypothetical protein [Candidatus Absconditabacteria bacterium]
MNIEEKANNQSLKIQLSLASLMFFSPFVKYLIKTSNFELDNKDNDFVQSYISLGWINIVLLLLALVTGLASYFYFIPIIETIYQIIIGLLIIVLTIGCIGAITETKIINSVYSNKNTLEEFNNTNKIHTILGYLPGYSIYLWYNKHDFEKPDLLIKESFVMWILFGISCFIPIQIISIFVFVAIVVRIVSLLGNINIVSKKISEFISSLFYKNPEEIWGYIWGSIVFVLHGNYNLPYWKLLVENTKKEYQYLYDIKKFGSIQRQYGLLLVGIVLILLQVDLGNISGLAVISIILILIRYGIMIFVWGRSPAIPLMREIVMLLNTIIKPFTSKK